MIRMRVDFFSESLAMGTSAVVLLPQSAAGQIGLDALAPQGAPPVLYLLHGLSDDCTIWERRTSIERYASDAGIAVVMPEVRRSFYVDEAVGEKYWTYISEELPEIIGRSFRVSQAREDALVAGLSMGGFGALKLALNHPERFAAAASLSGVVDLAGSPIVSDPRFGNLAERVWAGADIAGTADDIPGLLRAAAPGSLPRLYLACGTEDSLIDANRAVIELARERGHEPTVSLVPGVHEWGLWDREIRAVIDWLPIRER